MHFNSNLKLSELEKTELESISKLNSRRFDEILKIYIEFSKFLKLVNVAHTFWAGSALGAHLYSDFIPWDDDIDIAIQFKDRSKVIAEFSKYMPKNFELICHETGPWCFPLMKVINKDFPIDALKSELPKYARYLWIDVTFVTSTNTKKVPKQILFSGHVLFAKNAKQGLIIDILKLPLKLIPTKLLSNIMKKQMESAIPGNYCLEQLQFMKINTANIDFDNLIKMKFRGIEVPVPSNYIEHFKTQYPGSDFYKIPDKKFTHEYKVKGIDY